MIRASAADASESAEVLSLRRALARERAKIAAVREIGLALGSTLRIDELLGLIAQKISEATEADRTTIYLIDGDGEFLVSRAAQASELDEIRLRIGEGIAGAVAKNGEIVNLVDAYADSRFSPTWDRLTGYRTRSILCVPMHNQYGRTIGVVQSLNKRSSDRFDTDDVALVEALASEAAVSIENSKLFRSVIEMNTELLEAQERLQQKVRELDLLFDVAQVAAGALEIEELLQGFLSRAARAIGADAASVLLADQGTGDLVFRAAYGGPVENVRGHRIKAGQGICGWVAQNQQAQMVNDVGQDRRHVPEISAQFGYRPRSVLSVPLRWDSGFGAMELLNKGGGRDAFTEDDLKLATVVAGYISQAMQDAEQRIRQARQEHLSSIGQMLSGVLHDLKTPMTVISGYAKIMADERDAEQRAILADKVRRQVQTMNAMTRETLAFAKGEQNVWIRKVYLYRFFEEIEETLGGYCADRSIGFTLDLRDRGVAYLDEAKIQRVLHNLVRNAVEALGPGGGNVRITVDRDRDGTLVIAVEDDGPGIPEAIRGRLFQSFATHGKPKGTGLGLAIVKRMVEDHQGTIEVDSVPGHTAFTIRLPQNEPSTEESQEA